MVAEGEIALYGLGWTSELTSVSSELTCKSSEPMHMRSELPGSEL